jgi:ATP-dependent DNA helicase DinG
VTLPDEPSSAEEGFDALEPDVDEFDELALAGDEPADDEPAGDEPAEDEPVERGSSRRPAAWVLGPEGPLAAALGGYEAREGQLAMAEAVERALDGASILLCEAGTGTGKTLAYLVPAMKSGQRVVISTATKALEEQIVQRFVPMVTPHLARPVEVALAKGLTNYLCRRRFEEARRDPRIVMEHRRSLPLLERWARQTETGDVAELSEIAEDDPLLELVTSSKETRIGQGCPHYEACFVTKMKRDIARARVVVVSHHLFFADLAVKAQAGDAAGAARAGVLPPYDAVVFDEAHRIEDVVSDFFGARLSTARVGATLRDTEAALVRAGLADRMLVRDDGVALVREAHGRAAALFEAARSVLRAAGSADGRAPLERDDLEGILRRLHHELDEALEALEHFAELHATTEGIDVALRRLATLRADAARVLEPATSDVVWVEVKGPSTTIGASVVAAGRILRERVFERTGGVVLTSATLTSVPVARARRPNDASDVELDEPPRREVSAPASTFSFVRERLGLDELAGVPIDELEVGSPFDFARSAVLYVPKDLPEPSEEGFVDLAAERILELCSVTGGGAFVLTTSLRAMKSLGAHVRRGAGREVWIQGDAPKGTLIERFRAHGHAILVATMGFWEGVDVPGDALRLVILDKLPFAVPSDPIYRARAMALEARGADPFAAYAVPDAAIALKQGVGRLLRTREDRGIVAVLDKRLVTRGYGRRIRERLPPLGITHRLDDVREFWQRITAERAGQGR